MFPPLVSRIGLLAIALALVTAPAIGWIPGPTTSFNFSRFDAGYYPHHLKVYFLGGRLGDGSTDGSIWVFDPATGLTTDTGVDLPVPVSNYTVNLLRDLTGWGFYVFGGRDNAGTTVRTVQVFYPDTGVALALPAADDFPNPLGCLGALNLVHDDKVWVVGGFYSLGPTYNHGETWLFSPRNASGSRWSRIATADLSAARSYIMGAALDGKLYAVGGSWYDGSSLVSVATVEVLDPKAASPAWSDADVADLPEGCSEGRAWVVDHRGAYLDPADVGGVGGHLLVTCGGWPDENDHTYLFHGETGTWEPGDPLLVPRRDFAAELLPPSTEIATGIWLWGGRSGSDTEFLNTSEVLPLRASNCDILLVDDDIDNGSAWEGGWPYYWTALDQLGYYPTFYWHDSFGTPSLATLRNYEAVVWYTGMASGDVVSAADEAELIAYLQQGGNLFLSSTDQLYAHGLTTLASTYLGVGSYTNDVQLQVAHGNPADPISSHLGIYAFAPPNDWDIYWSSQLYSDEVHAAAGTVETMVWETVHTPNALRKQGTTYRTEFLPWPFEFVNTRSQRAELLGNVLHWICPLLKDGFESGGTGEWSRVVP